MMPLSAFRAPLTRLIALSGIVLSACAQPLTIAPSDAATVLAHRTITAPNPGEKGPRTVGHFYYGSGKDIRRPEFRDSITYRTRTVDASPYARMEPAQAKSRKKYWGYDNTAFPLNGRVWYPQGEGKFPLVLVVHGNHDMKEFSDPGYQWLGELLASRGFILASIDENFLNGSIRNENDARGWMLLKHLEVFRALNDSTGKPLFGKIDMTRIALMGHSRGGEAVAIAGAFNRLPAYPDDATQRFNFNFDIKSLIAIAPVDGQYRPAEQPTPVSDYNYLVIHGSHDGDVSSFSGLTQYNRFRYTRSGPEFKSAIWMHRANHGQWNTVWNNKDNGDYSVRALQLKALIDGEEQRRFGRVVIGGFLEATLNGRDEYRAMFRDYRTAGDWLPPTMYLTRYADARTQFLATFDEDVDVTSGTVRGVRLSGDSLSTWREADMPSRSRANTFRSNAATLGWNNTPIGTDTTTPRWAARFTVSLSDSLVQALALSPRHALVLTVGSTDQKPGARRVTRDTTKRDSTKSDSASKARPPRPANRPPAKPAKDTVAPDLTLELEDVNGQIARLPLSTFGAVRMPIESYIYRRRGRDKTQFPTLSEPVMQTYIAPLTAFQGSNSALNVSKLKAVRLVFDRKRVGAIQLDDIGIVRPE
ncbi:MAG: MFS transporter [Gemmatimonadaceae bacterium]|nr:MFS transporter [Gemmatimonadaceae bacterium]